MFLAEPHGQLGHLPLGQLPPQVSAKARARIKARRTMNFIILNYIFGYGDILFLDIYFRISEHK